jgi:hypothetical protein
VPVGLVLLDLNMPVKNGWATFERLTGILAQVRQSGVVSLIFQGWSGSDCSGKRLLGTLDGL